MGIGFVLLLLTSMPLLTPASAGSKSIHATGSIFSTVPYVLGSATVGGNTVQTRALVSTYTGTLIGTQNDLQQRIVNSQTSLTSATGEFTGTLAGSAIGTFAATYSTTGDSSGCPCPPGTITFTGAYVVVSGTGQGAFAGICGGGTFKGSGDAVNGFTTTYDYTFHFGESCHSNGD